MNVLNFFFRISGLRVNIEKTSAIWIGSKCNSNAIILPDHNLHWVKVHFKILGVIFSTNLDEMVELNYNVAYDSIRQTLCSWSNRNLTPLGKVTVIKSLALPKLNYYCLTLPNPPPHFIKDLYKLFYDFIWNKKPDKIKKLQLCNDYEYGGMKMIYINNFITALKLTWVRKMYNGGKNCFLFYKNISNSKDFLETSIESIKSNLHNISNKFWFDVTDAWIKFNTTLLPKNETEFLSMCLWNNHLITIGGKPIVFQSLKNNGIYFVNDLFKCDGSFYDYHTFCQEFHLSLNFLHFIGLKRALGTIFDLNRVNKKLTMPIRPFRLDILLRSQKGCQVFYRVLNDSTNLSNNRVKSKWERDMGIVIPDRQWRDINRLPFNTLMSSKLIWFQYRLTNRILGTNVLLRKIGIRDSDLCSFCNLVP